MTVRVRPLSAVVVAMPALIAAPAVGFQLLAESVQIRRIGMVVLVVATIVAVIAGLLRYRPAARAGWIAGIVAVAFFLAGYLVRGSTGYADPHAGLLPDLCTVASYLALLLGLLGFVQPRRHRWNTDHVLDIAVVVVSGLLASWTLLAWPVLSTSHAPGLRAGLMAVYPMFDTVLAALLVHWVLIRSTRGTSLVLVEAGLALAIAGDLAMSLDAAGITRIGDRFTLIPIMVAIASFGTAALLPSMRAVGEDRPALDHRARQRAVLIGVVLVVAASIPALRLRTAPLDRWMIATLLALLLLSMLLRSERSRNEEVRARHRADHDVLTGLPNRAMLLRTMAALPPTVSVLFIDLDGFKAVNDQYGHGTGDELLVEVGERLRSSIRRSDVLARYGGDEFVVVAAVDRADAETLANRIRAELRAPFRLRDDLELTVSASIGVASAAEGLSPANLIRHADQAMYAAKAGRTAAKSPVKRASPHPISPRVLEGGKVRAG